MDKPNIISMSDHSNAKKEQAEKYEKILEGGYTRTIDEFKRVALPIEILKDIGMNAMENIRVSKWGDKVVISKIVPVCTFCNSPSVTRELHNKYACVSCVSTFLKE